MYVEMQGETKLGMGFIFDFMIMLFIEAWI